MKKWASFSLMFTAVALLLTAFMADTVPASGYEDSSSVTPEYLYYIEGTGSYLLPGEGYDTFFNRGSWYRWSEGTWSMSGDLDGPWSGITKDSLPKDLAGLPPDFRETRKLGMIPYKYAVGSDSGDDDHAYRYYRGRYYEDYERHGYRRRWHSRGRFWFFVAPDLDD